MLTAARVEPAQMQTINDMVQALFDQHTLPHFLKNTAVFVLHMVATLTQMFIMNDPTAENFRTGPNAIIIYLMLLISTCCDVYLGKSEINSFYGSS